MTSADDDDDDDCVTAAGAFDAEPREHIVAVSLVECVTP